MIKANTSYRLNLVEPFKSVQNYPIKLFAIPNTNVLYRARYTPVTLHSSLLMTDYLLGSKLRLSDTAFANFEHAIKEQFNAHDEFIVVTGTRSDLGATTQSLAYYGDKGDERGAHTETININGEKLVVEQAVVVDKFKDAYRNLKRNAQVHFSVASNRDRRHNMVNLKSLSFLRDRVHGLELAKLAEYQRDNSHGLFITQTIKAARDYVNEAEISFALGNFQRDYIGDLTMVNISQALRDDIADMSVSHSLQQFQRDYIADMDVAHSVALADRTYVFDMVKDFYIQGERPIKKDSTVRWEHVIAERIIESDLTVQQALVFHRNKVKGGHVSFAQDFHRDRLKETIIHYALNQGKLKARQYPSHVHFGARPFDLLKQRQTEIRRTVDVIRDIRSNLVMPVVGESVRDITGITHIHHDTSRYKRDNVSVANIHQNLINPKHDNVRLMDVGYTLGNSVRDNVADISVLYNLIKSKRDNVDNMSVLYNDTKQFLRDFVSDMSILDSVIDTKRIYNEKHLYVPTRPDIVSTRDSVAEMDIGFTTKEFDRDKVSGLYLVKNGEGQREISKDLAVEHVEESERNNSHILHLSEMSNYERNKVKELLLSFIGDYVRSNQSSMGGTEIPPETEIGGALPPTVFDAMLMDDEILGELVDSFAALMDSVYLGESLNERQGDLLAENMQAVRERIEGMYELGFLGTSKDRGGLLLFPDQQGLVERGIDLAELSAYQNKKGAEISEVGSYQRIDKGGQNIEQDYLGQVNDREGVTNNSVLGQRIDYEGLSEEDKMTFGYFFADAADFLSPDELASLPDNRGGNLNEGLSMGKHPIGNGGYIAYDVNMGNQSNGGYIAYDINMGTHPIINGGNLDNNGFVELLGFHSTIVESHLHEDMIFAVTIKKELQAVMHETLDATALDDRESIKLDDLFMGTRPNILGDMLESNLAHTEKSIEISEVQLFTKDDHSFDLLESINLYKEKLVYIENEILASLPGREGLVESEISASLPDRVGEIEKGIAAVKEKLFVLDRLVTGDKTDRDFHLEEFTLAEKTGHNIFVDTLFIAGGKLKDSVIEQGILADHPIREGIVEHSINASRPDKQGYIESELVSYKEKFSYVEGELVSYKEKFSYVGDGLVSYKEKFSYVGHSIYGHNSKYATVQTEYFAGQRTNEFDAVALEEYKLGQRVNEFSAATMAEYKLGQRVNLLESHTMEDYKLGQRIDEFSATAMSDYHLGQPVNIAPSISEDLLTFGFRPRSFGTISTENYQGTGESENGHIEHTYLTSTKLKSSFVARGTIDSEKFHDAYVELGIEADKVTKNSILAIQLQAEKNDKESSYLEQYLFNKGEKESSYLEQYLFNNDEKESSYLEQYLFNNDEKEAATESFIVSSRQGRNGFLDEPHVHADKLKDAYVTETVDAVKEKIGELEHLIYGERPAKLGYVETDSLLGNVNAKGSYLINTELQFERIVSEGLVADEIIAKLVDKQGITLSKDLLGSHEPHSTLVEENTSYLFNLSGLSSNLIDGTGLESSKNTFETSLTVNENSLAIKQGKSSVTPATTVEANLLEKYSITQDQYLEASTYMWVGILTNLLVADEEKAKSYVDYLVQAGAVDNKHYKLLNGLVGDLALKQGAAFNKEIITDLEKSKAELIEGLQGKGFLYDYDDFNSVLNPAMDIEEWELDLGFSLPERYDPYDPYNSYYPSLLENYGQSALSLMQSEEWETFGGSNWERDELHGTFRSIADNTNGNGYYLNKNGLFNYKISADFKVNKDEPENDGVGIVFKYTDELNYYKFVIVGGPTNSIGMNMTNMQLYRVVNGAQQPIGSAISPEHYEKGEWHNIKVSYVDKEILIWVNNRLQYEIYDI